MSTVFSKIEINSLEGYSNLSSEDKLKYILKRFSIGMNIEISIPSYPDRDRGTIIGFYSYNDKNMKYPVNEITNSQRKVPESINIFCRMEDGRIKSFYPLWVKVDHQRERDRKLKEVLNSQE